MLYIQKSLIIEFVMGSWKKRLAQIASSEFFQVNPNTTEHELV